jgi:hypothetical protein
MRPRPSLQGRRSHLLMLVLKATNKLSRSAISGCIRTFQRPLFSLPDTPYSDWILSLETPPVLCDGIKYLIKTFIFDHQFLKILYRIQSLITMLTSSIMTPVTVDALVTSIQGDILLLLIEAREDLRNDSVQTFCGIAYVLFLDVVKYSYFPPIMQQPFITSSTGEVMAQKMKFCIIELEQLLEIPRDFLLWATFLGGTTVPLVEDRKWFSGRLVKVASDMQLDNWEQAKASLLRYSLISSIFEKLCREFWDHTYSGII